MAKYTDPKRKEVPDATVIADVLSAAFGYAGERSAHELPEGFSLMHAHAGDAKEIAALYRSVFKTYPFPIFDPEYIQGVNAGTDPVFYYQKIPPAGGRGILRVDAENQNAEVTDFATDPDFRGMGLAGILLHAMETEMKKEGILLAYTIARAISRPINPRLPGGYQFGGCSPIIPTSADHWRA